MRVLSPRPTPDPDADDEFRSATPTGRMMHRDATLLRIERKVADLWTRGYAPASIASTLGLAETVVRDVILRNAPAVK